MATPSQIRSYISSLGSGPQSKAPAKQSSSSSNMAAAFMSSSTPKTSTSQQINAILGMPGPMSLRSSGSSSRPIYPTPTGAPIPSVPTTIRAGGGSSSSGAPTVLGASYIPTFQTPTTMTARSLSSSDSFSPMSLPSPSSYTLATTPGTSNFDMSSLLTPTMAAYGYTVKDGQLVPPTEEAPQEVGTMDKYVEKIKSILPKPQAKLDTYKQMQEQAQIKEKQNVVNSLTSQLNNIVATRDANLESLRQVGSQEGVTEAVYGGQQLQINREAAIKALPIAAQLTAAQNDLETAKSYVDTYFKIYSDDVDAQQNYLTDLYKTAFQYANDEQKQRLSELATEKANAFTLKRDAISQANEIAKLALQNGQGSVYSAITSLNPDDPNYAQKVAQYGGQVSGKTSNQIIGSAETGYSNVITDASGRVISTTPISGGTSGNGGLSSSLKADLAQDLSYLADNTVFKDRASAQDWLLRNKTALITKYNEASFNQMLSELDRLFPPVIEEEKVKTGNFWSNLFGGNQQSSTQRTTTSQTTVPNLSAGYTPLSLNTTSTSFFSNLFE